MPVILLLSTAFGSGVALAAEAPAPSLPPSVAQDCLQESAQTGLHHLRCGPARLIVAQLQPVETDVHDELLVSVLDLVPGPASRNEGPTIDPDLRRTVVRQHRASLGRDDLSVHLVLTTRRSTGRSVACVVGQVDRRRVDRRELDWCESITRSLLPAPVVVPTTRIDVQEPDLPDDAFSG